MEVFLRHVFTGVTSVGVVFCISIICLVSEGVVGAREVESVDGYFFRWMSVSL